MTKSDAIKTIQLDICNGCECIENCITNQCEYFLAINALEEIQQYQALGTVEELRLAKEKQMPMKPIMKKYFDDMEEEYLCCPTCGEILTDRMPMDNKDFYFHCLNCGQKLNWESDEE